MFRNLFGRRAETTKAAAGPVGISLPEILAGMARVPTFTDWSQADAVALGYKANAALNACINKRADELEAVPWVAKLNGEPMPDSPLQRLIDAPNPDMAFSQIIAYIVQMLDLAGNVYLSKIIVGVTSREVREIWPLDPRGMVAKRGAQRLIGQWEYRAHGSTRPVEFTPEQICQIKNPNPESFIYGLPTMLASGRGVDIYREARDAQKASFENRGLADIAVILDPTTTAEQFERIKDKHKERNQGSANNRAPLFSTRDIKTLGTSPAEMDYTASVQSVINEICSVLGVPPQMIGYLEDATLANYATSRKILWVNTLIPLLRRVQAQLQRGIAADFGPGWTIEPDLSAVDALADDYNQNVEAAAKLWAMGVPFNEINKRLDLGFDEIEGGEVGYLAGGLIPANVDWSTPAGQGTPEDMAKALAALGYGQ
jgi:HK97 family phage portal protein